MEHTMPRCPLSNNKSPGLSACTWQSAWNVRVYCISCSLKTIKNCKIETTWSFYPFEADMVSQRRYQARGCIFEGRQDTI